MRNVIFFLKHNFCSRWSRSGVWFYLSC